MSYLIFSFFVLLQFSLAPEIRKEGMLFPEFSDGIVLFKDGTKTAAMLNYDTFEEQMIFQNDGEIMALANPEKVEHIEIQKRTFVWYQNDIFLEKIDSASVILYQRRRSILQSKGKETSFGGVSQSSAVSTVNSLARGYDKQMGNLSKKEEFGFKTDVLYYIESDGKYKNISLPKQISKVFNLDTKEVEAFIRSNDINFTEVDDMVRLIRYCINVE